jgi:signal transduction histidine kinase
MKGSSVLAQTAALAFAALLIATVLNFAVVLLAPAPPEARMSVGEAARALRAEAGSRLSVRESGSPPAGARSRLLEASLGHQLHLPPGQVRAVWMGTGAGRASGAGQSVVLVGARDVVVDSSPVGFTMRYGAGVELEPDTPVPPFTAAIRLPDGRWRDVAPPDPWYAAWRLRMAAIFVGGMLLLAWPVWRATRRLVGPIRRLGDAAAATRLVGAAPFPVQGPREVRAVARAMNDMHQRLVAQALERARILASMAHDLRTPLTGLRLRAESAPPPERDRMVADLERMAAMIDEVLAYSRLGEHRIAHEPVDLAALLRECVDDRVALGQPVTLENVASCVIHGDGLLLRRAFDNLVDNGIRYGLAVRVSLVVASGVAWVRFDDRGPGIPPDQLARATEPFWRHEPSRSRATGGIGLGLAIVRDAAQSHGGELALSNLPEGGLRAQVALPTGQGVGDNSDGESVAG